MGGFLRVILIFLPILSVVYVSLLLYFRAGLREKYEREWHDKGMAMDRSDFIETRLRQADPQLRQRLAIGVYVIPTALFALLIYFTNSA